MKKNYKFFIDLTSIITIEADSCEEAREKVTVEKVKELFENGMFSVDITLDEEESDYDE